MKAECTDNSKELWLIPTTNEDCHYIHYYPVTHVALCNSSDHPQARSRALKLCNEYKCPIKLCQ